MLANQMPPLTWAAYSAIDEICECYAYCYLARYNGAAQSTSSAQSFTNAFSPSNISRGARVDGGAPSWVVVLYDYGQVKRLVVAIEGMTSTSQLSPAWVGPNSQSMNPLPGFCYSSFAIFATAIMADLMANPFFANNIGTPGCQVTFTGFSLGAGVAEILAVKCKAAFPNAQYRLVKFGAPRVGDANWVDGIDPNIDSKSYMVGNDRIDLVPYFTSAGVNSLSLTVLGQFTSYAPNVNQTRWNMTTGNYIPPPEESYSAYAATLIALADLPLTNPQSPWFYHDYDAYRLAFNNLAAFADSYSSYRFRYLEFNDDNQWQVNYHVGASAYIGLAGLGTEPAPFDQFPSPAEIAREMRRNEQPRVPQNPMPVAPVLPTRVVPSPGLWVPRRTRSV